MVLVFRCIAALPALVAATLAWAADPIAFLADLRGDVTLDGVGKPPILAELLPGSRLVLGRNSAAAVMYIVSGDEFSLKGPGEFSVRRDEVSATAGATPAKRAALLRPKPAVLIQVSKVAAASLRMRGAPVQRSGSPGPEYPVNAKVTTLQPKLRWSAAPDAGGFTVVVLAADGKEVFRGPARSTSLHLPVKLAPGSRFSWSYSATGQTARDEAIFETFALDVVRAAENTRAAAKTFPDLVLLALWLRELGADQDAREIWLQLASERPDLPEIAGLAR